MKKSGGANWRDFSGLKLMDYVHPNEVVQEKSEPKYNSSAYSHTDAGGSIHRVFHGLSNARRQWRGDVMPHYYLDVRFPYLVVEDSVGYDFKSLGDAVSAAQTLLSNSKVHW
jgi:hypothetical protein